MFCILEFCFYNDHNIYKTVFQNNGNSARYMTCLMMSMIDLPYSNRFNFMNYIRRYAKL